MNAVVSEKSEIHFKGVFHLNEVNSKDFKHGDAFFSKDYPNEIYVWTGNKFITFQDFIHQSIEDSIYNPEVSNMAHIPTDYKEQSGDENKDGERLTSAADFKAAVDRKASATKPSLTFEQELAKRDALIYGSVSRENQQPEFLEAEAEIQRIISETNKKLPDPDEIPRTDAGILAANLIRKYQADLRKRARQRFFFGFLFLAGLAMIAAGMGSWAMRQMVEGRYTDIRKCGVMLGSEMIEAERSYSYPYRSLFGYRMIDERNIEEKTEMTVANSKLTVVGLTEDKWWRANFEIGEKGVKIFKPADTYIFMNAKDTTVVSYKAFCQ